MKKKHRTSAKSAAARAAASKSASKAAEPADPIDRLETVCRFALVALLVATPLIPSESAVQLGTGTVFVMLWTVLLVAWSVATVLRRGGSSLRIGWTTAALLGFLACYGASGLIHLPDSQARFVLNSVWQWFSFGVAFFLIRQLIDTPARCRALIAVLFALAILLSAHGFYQYFVSLPEARARYELDPDAVIREAGMVAPEGSPQRWQFESRLYSVEPTATFALTNSLAGFLAPWTIVAVGILLTNWSLLRRHPIRLLLLAACFLVVGGCLLLTKSRSAYIACLFGLGLVVVGGHFRQRIFRWQVVVPLVLFLLGLVGAAVLVGGLDAKVVTEAFKSLEYRFEYWRASWRMIEQQPWWGCGPGNFQTIYTLFKLPQSSETVADPHNFLLEIWSTAGSLAAIAFLGTLAAAGLQWWRVRPTQADVPAEASDHQPNSTSGLSGHVIYLGASAGLLLAVPCGWLVGFIPQAFVLLAGLPLGGMVLVLLNPWVRDGECPGWLPLAAGLALLVNLSAAGGVSLAGVALTGWLLLALALNLRQPIATPLPRSAGALLFLGSAALAGACFWTLYRPMLTSESQLSMGRLLQSQGRNLAAGEAYRKAARQDPYTPEPWEYLGSLYQKQLAQTGDPAFEAPLAESVRQAVRRNPRSSNLHTQIGNWYLELYEIRGERPYLDRAVEAYERAAARYPNSNFRQAQLAWAYFRAGQPTRAGSLAEKALELDAINPHWEQKLAQRVLFEGPQPAGAPPQPSAEQRMVELRNQ